MQFTKAEEYGMLGVLYLADKEQGLVTPLSEISEAQEIPEKFLAKIFQSLSRTGIVRSHRGVRGGFTLAKDPGEISIKEVLESIHGPYHLVKCMDDSGICKKSEYCALKELLQKAEDKLVAILKEHTLSDLVGWEKKHKANIAEVK